MKFIELDCYIENHIGTKNVTINVEHIRTLYLKPGLTVITFTNGDTLECMQTPDQILARTRKVI